MISGIKNSEPGYFHIKNDLLDKWLRIIGPGAFIVYQEFVRFCPGGKDTPFPNVSMIDWAAWIGISYLSFSKHIETLEKYGLIKIIQGRNKSRFVKESHKYEILPLPEVMIDDAKKTKPFPKGVKHFGDLLRGENIFKTKEDSPYKEFIGTEPIKSIGKDLKNVKDINNTVKSNNTISPTTERSEDVCWLRLAILLSKIVQLEHKLSTPLRKIKTWAKDIKKLSTVEKVPLDRIKDAMRWYAENHGEQGQYSLVIECGSSFREKFARLEKAMNRDNGIGSTIRQSSDLDVGSTGRNYKRSELTKEDNEDNE